MIPCIANIEKWLSCMHLGSVNKIELNWIEYLVYFWEVFWGSEILRHFRPRLVRVRLAAKIPAVSTSPMVFQLQILSPDRWSCFWLYHLRGRISNLGSIHQCFTSSFCTRRSQKRKKDWLLDCIFCAFGICAHKTLVKGTPVMFSKFKVCGGWLRQAKNNNYGKGQNNTQTEFYILIIIRLICNGCLWHINYWRFVD